MYNYRRTLADSLLVGMTQSYCLLAALRLTVFQSNKSVRPGLARLVYPIIKVIGTGSAARHTDIGCSFCTWYLRVTPTTRIILGGACAGLMQFGGECASDTGDDCYGHDDQLDLFHTKLFLVIDDIE